MLYAENTKIIDINILLTILAIFPAKQNKHTLYLF